MELLKMTTIAQSLGFNDLMAELNALAQRQEQENCPLILPLVGEFSSGKTTLINALTDSKKLETATKPTTATIYQIHFGSESCHATVCYEDGKQIEVKDIAELKNDAINDAAIVDVYDTSNKVPSTTILVDTPGLSSPDPRHKQTLVDFLPQADAILLVSDINQQITRSITDFIKTMSLAKRQIFLVLTKSDTKSASDLIAAKEYISKNTEIPLAQVACVSAIKNDMSELYELFDSIQKSKGDILQRVNEQRLSNIAKEMLGRIDRLMSASSSDKETDEAIHEQQYSLDKLNRNIDRLISDLRSDINDIETSIFREFENKVFDSLDTIVAGNSNDFDSEAISTINSLSSLLLADYKVQVQKRLREKAESRSQSDDAVNLRSISELDMSSYAINGLSYNLNLNTIGHEKDGAIANGLKVAAAVAAVATAGCALASAAEGVATAGAATGAATGAGATAGATAGAAASSASALGAADLVLDAGTILYARSKLSKMERMAKFAGQASEHLTKINDSDRKFGEQMGASKGMVESLVGFVTENMCSKPQRRRAIINYIDGTLAPQFKSELSQISNALTQAISDILHQEASTSAEQMVSALNELKSARTAKEAEFKERMAKLKDYKRELSIL